MSLAVKSFCCGKSLRCGALILLYFNLIITAWGLLSALLHWNSTSSVYTDLMSDNVDLAMNLIFSLVQCSIFLGAIMYISKEKPNSGLLIASVVILLLDVVFLIYTILLVNFSDKLDGMMRKQINESLNRKSANDRPIDQDEFKRKILSVARSILNVVLILALAFKSYSALIIHSFKVEWKQRQAGNIPNQYYHKEANVSPPPAYNPQFAAPQYPIQNNKYSAVPSEMNQYPVLPPPYPTQAAPIDPGFNLK